MPFLDRRHLGEGLPPQLDLLLDSALEANNFHPLPPGTSFGLARNGAGLKVLDNQHQDVTEQFLHNRNGRIVARPDPHPRQVHHGCGGGSTGLPVLLDGPGARCRRPKLGYDAPVELGICKPTGEAP